MLGDKHVLVLTTMVLVITGSNIKYMETQFEFLSDIIESLLFGITVDSFDPIESIRIGGSKIQNFLVWISTKAYPIPMAYVSSHAKI